MSIMKISKGGDFQSAAAGVYPAVCVQVVDLGTQDSEYNGKKKKRHEMLLRFELHGESLTTDANGYMLDDNGEPDPTRPFLEGAFLTVSFNEEATLRKYLESWRGAPYSDDDIERFYNEGFDWSRMLGQPCMVKIAPNSNGKLGIRDVSKLQKNIQPPKPVNQMFAFTLSDFKDDAWEMVSDKLKDKIRKSPEYQQIFNVSAAPLTHEQRTQMAAAIDDSDAHADWGDRS